MTFGLHYQSQADGHGLMNDKNSLFESGSSRKMINDKMINDKMINDK